MEPRLFYYFFYPYSSILEVDLNVLPNKTKGGGGEGGGGGKAQLVFGNTSKVHESHL